MEEDRAAPRYAPMEPHSIEEAGTTQGYLVNLALKTLYSQGESSAGRIADEFKLPYVNIVDRVLEFLKREALVSITGGDGISEQTFRYVLTSEGSRRAQEALLRSQYIGAAPVTLTDYYNVVLRQTIGDLSVTGPQVAEALDHLVLPQKVLDQLGPAINSGRSIFIYGAPGGGKSTVAEGVGPLLGEDIYIPYAVDVGGEIIQVYDAQVHDQVLQHEPSSSPLNGAPAKTRTDARWVRCRRPLIETGGELTLETLDLVYDEYAKYYEAPLQMKANGGMFLVDDFGRQLVRPVDLLNRWLVPLEKRVDFLTLHNGRKIQIPFDVLIVFSTNLDPKDLVDEAFLRRIRHKIEIGSPTPEEFRLIMLRVCVEWGMDFDEGAFQHLLQKHYVETEREMRGVHPRDLIQQLIDIAKYRDLPPLMTPALIDAACDSYFVRM